MIIVKKNSDYSLQIAGGRMFILTQKWLFVKFGAKQQFLNRLRK